MERSLCKTKWIPFSCFLFGPLGAVYLAFNNFKALGNDKYAKNMLIYGMLISFFMIIALFVIPLSKKHAIIGPIILAGLVKVLIEPLMKNKVDKALASGRKKYPFHKWLGVSLASAVVTLAIGMGAYAGTHPGIFQENHHFQKMIAADKAGDYKTMLKYLAPLAKQRIPEAQNDLGIAYDYGHGVNVDHKKAFLLYQKAAQQGLADAEVNLGSAYIIGRGVKQNMKLGIEWTRKSAEKGNLLAQLNMAKAYRLGVGVDADFDKEVKWLKRAAGNGSVEAKNILKQMHQDS